MNAIGKLWKLDGSRRRALAAYAVVFVPVRLLVRVVSVQRARGLARRLARLVRAPFASAVDPRSEIVWTIAAFRRGTGAVSSCLPESVAAEALARAVGLPARIHLGFRRAEDHGIVGHAWAESEGRPLGNPAEGEPFAAILRAPDHDVPVSFRTRSR